MAPMRDARGRFIKKGSLPGVDLTVDWHGQEVFMKLANAEDNIISKICLATEAQTKDNISKPFEHKDGSVRGQIDTGAMTNSTRAILDKSALPSGIVGAVSVGTEYAIYQEQLRAFLMPAAQSVMEDVGGIVESVKRMGGLF